MPVSGVPGRRRRCWLRVKRCGPGAGYGAGRYLTDTRDRGRSVDFPVNDAHDADFYKVSRSRVPVSGVPGRRHRRWLRVKRCGPGAGYRGYPGQGTQRISRRMTHMTMIFAKFRGRVCRCREAPGRHRRRWLRVQRCGPVPGTRVAGRYLTGTRGSVLSGFPGE